MKRRNFLKLIGISVAVPSTVLATSKILPPGTIPVLSDKPLPWRNYYAEYTFYDEFAKPWENFHKEYKLTPKQEEKLIKELGEACRNAVFNHPFNHIPKRKSND